MTFSESLGTLLGNDTINSDATMEHATPRNQWKYSWEPCFLCGPLIGYIWRIETQTSEYGLEPGVSRWETDPSEVATDSRSRWRRGRRRSTNCWKPLHRNSEVDANQWRRSRLRRPSACRSGLLSVQIRGIIVANCSYDMYESNKSDYQSRSRL